MRMAKRSVSARSPLIRVWLVAGAVVLCAPVAARAINAVTPATGVVNQRATAAQFSPGVADVVKLLDAKVDTEVIKTYVKNSPTAYNPSATEIISLKDRGVAPEILTALLQHGAEVRAQSMQAAQAAPGVAAPPAYPNGTAPYAPAPPYDYTTQPVYPNYGYSYPADSSAYPGYNYGYNDYGSSWPLFWPSFYFGGYPYHGYSGRGYGHYHGGGGYSGHGGRAVSFAGHSGGFRSFASGGRAGAFTGSAGGFRSAGGSSGHSVSFASHASHGGGFGGHGSGRGR